MVGQTAILIGITFFASFAITLSGFGFALVSMSVYPNFMSVATANGLASMLGLLIILINLTTLWKHIDFKLLMPVLISAALGVPVGAFLLIKLDEQILRIALGVIILLSLTLNEISGRGKVRKPSARLGIVAGFVSGAFGGAYSISGPPVTLYFSTVIEEKLTLKANLLFYFAVVVILRLPILALQKVITVSLLKTSLVLAAPLLVGLAAGLVSFRFLPSRWMRRVTQILLVVSSIILIVRAI